MPIINRAEYNKAEAKQGGGGGFSQPEPGVYELYVQAVRLEWDTRDGHTDGLSKQCARIVWDFASGEFERKYTEAYFVDWDGQPDPDKDFMHSCYLSWKNLEYLKGRFQAFEAANPSFDPLAAFEADQWQMFVGKRFWAVLDGTLTTNRNGYDNWQLDVGAWITPEQARTGEHPEPKVEDKRGAQARGGAPAVPAAQGASYAV